MITGYGIIPMTGNFMTIRGLFYRLMGIASTFPHLKVVH